jgi:DNA-binding MarR family transcriptional regulator
MGLQYVGLLLIRRYTTKRMNRQRLERAAEDLNRGAIHLLRGLGGVDRRAGLTPSRLSALSVLVFGGPHSISGLAAAEGVAPPTMTRIVDGLEGLGLARRTVHPYNGRIRLVEVTEAGRALMQEAASRRIQTIADALARAPSSECDSIVAAAKAIAALPTHLAP